MLQLHLVPVGLNQRQVGNPDIFANAVCLLQTPKRKGVIVAVGEQNRILRTRHQEIVGIVVGQIVIGAIITLEIRHHSREWHE